MRVMARAGLVGAGMLALAYSGAGLAADLAEGEAPQITVIGERIVQDRGTASKTGVDPRDVPASIAVVPDEVIAGQADRTLNEVLANASAVSPSYGGGYGIADNYVVRGLPVRFLRDGLPDGPSFNGYRRTTADIEAVEVLKGPGSALYGKAEAGGTVNIVTKEPLDRFAAHAEAAYGSFDSLYLTGDLGGPLANGIDTRLIGHFERADGYRGLARRATELLPTVAFDLGPDHTLTLDYDYRDSRVVPDNYGIPFTQARTIAALDPASRLYSPFDSSLQTIHRATVTDRAKVSPVLELRGALSFEHRDLSLARNGGGSILNAAGAMTGRNGRTQTDSDDFWTGQAEVILTPRTGAVSHTILLGAEYSSIGIDTVRNTYTLPNLPATGGLVLATDSPALIGTGALTYDRRIASDTLSVYAQEQADIADLVKLRIGGRYDSVKLVDAGLQSGAFRRIAGTKGLFSWQAGAVVKASKAVSFYGGYSQGKFVAINTEPNALTPDPESSSQIEAGVKASLFGGRLSANAALFETKRDGYFVTLVPGGDPVPVGRQRARGAELDLLGHPIDGLTVIGNFAWVDAVNRSNALASVSGLAGASNLPVYGKQIAATPRTSGSLWAQYDWSQGTLSGLFLGAGLTYKASVYVDSLELLKVPSYTIVRASIGYKWRGIEAQLTVANLTDARWYSTPTFAGALPGEPRNVLVSLRAGF